MLLNLVTKIRRKNDNHLLRLLHDHLASSRVLNPKIYPQLPQQHAQCRTPEDYFDFAARFNAFPAHQIRSEILAFLHFAQQHNPKTAVEIGTAQAGTHFLLSHALPTITHTLGIDLFVWNTRLLRALKRPQNQHSFIHASSYAPATVARATRILQGKPIDLLFIDGDHTYDGVKKDYLLYRHLVRPGGLIAFHDIVPDYETRHGTKTDRWAGDVPILWQQLKPHYPHHQFIENPEQDGLGIGVLIHDPATPLPPELQ